jgi:YD repeat-containing protein
MRRSILLAASALALVSVSGMAAEVISYTYDGRGRLIKVDHAGTVNNAITSSYSYDDADNRLTKVIGPTGGGGGSGVSFSISSNGAVTEGANSVFTITKSGTATTALSVTYATANGTAAAPGDYTAKSPTAVTFQTTETTKTVNVATATDALTEGNETFTMSLSSPTSPATITTGSAAATISDPVCAGVTFSIASNAAVTEGTGSVFTITKSGTASGSCNVNYASANGTATAGSDYTATSGTHTFTSAQTSKTVSVPTTDDTTVESAETLTMSLSAPTGGAAIGTPATATATINDNDSGGGGTGCTGVTFTSNNASGIEGDLLTFTISKAGSTATSCSISYATENSTATTNDFTAASGTLTFGSAQTSQTVSITTNDDFLTENTEVFVLRLSNPTGGATFSGYGTGTIDDNDTGLLSADPGAAPESPDLSPATDPPPSDPATSEPPAEAPEPPPEGSLE